MSVLREGDEQLHYSDNSHRWIAPPNIKQSAWDAGMRTHVEMHRAAMGSRSRRSSPGSSGHPLPPAADLLDRAAPGTVELPSSAACGVPAAHRTHGTAPRGPLPARSGVRRDPLPATAGAGSMEPPAPVGVRAAGRGVVRPTVDVAPPEVDEDEVITVGMLPGGVRRMVAPARIRELPAAARAMPAEIRGAARPTGQGRPGADVRVVAATPLPAVRRDRSAAPAQRTGATSSGPATAPGHRHAPPRPAVAASGRGGVRPGSL
jgi:hypothetical protein